MEKEYYTFALFNSHNNKYICHIHGDTTHAKKQVKNIINLHKFTKGIETKKDKENNIYFFIQSKTKADFVLVVQ